MPEPGRPPLTICVATFDRAHLLDRALERLTTFSALDFEVVVVDNHSGDETPAVIDRYTSRLRLEAWRQPRHLPLGPSVVAALHVADGRYVWFLSDDDLALEEGLERAVRILDEEPQVGVVFGGARYVREDGTEMGEIAVCPAGEPLRRIGQTEVPGFVMSHQLSCPVARTVDLQRLLYHEGHWSPGEKAGFAALCGRGEVVCIPDHLLVKLVHKEGGYGKMADAATVAQMHAQTEELYGLYGIPGAIDVQVKNAPRQLRMAERECLALGRFIEARAHFLRRAAYEEVPPEERMAWEQDYLLPATAERLGCLVAADPRVTRVVLEDAPFCRWVGEQLAAGGDGPEVAWVPKADLVLRPLAPDELVVAVEHDTLCRRSEGVPVRWSLQRALEDVATSLRVLPSGGVKLVD